MKISRSTSQHIRKVIALSAIYDDSTHTHLSIDVSRINDSFICIETIVGSDWGTELLDSTAPGWGCFNVTANGSEVSNYVDAGGSICSSKAGSRQYFEVPLNTSIVVIANFKDNTYFAAWNLPI